MECDADAKRRDWTDHAGDPCRGEQDDDSCESRRAGREP